MELAQLQELLKGGRFTKVVFTKRTTGEKRVMICRTGVHKGITGKGMAFNPDEKGLQVVFDVQKRAYRMISAESVELVHSGPRSFEITVGPGAGVMSHEQTV